MAKNGTILAKNSKFGEKPRGAARCTKMVHGYTSCTTPVHPAPDWGGTVIAAPSRCHLGKNHTRLRRGV